MKGTRAQFFHDNITNMGEVRACVYISVIFLCFQISVAKVGISVQSIKTYVGASVVI